MGDSLSIKSADLYILPIALSRIFGIILKIESNGGRFTSKGYGSMAEHIRNTAEEMLRRHRGGQPGNKNSAKPRRSKYTKAQVTQILKLKKSGLTYQEIVDLVKFEITKGSITNLLKRSRSDVLIPRDQA